MRRRCPYFALSLVVAAACCCQAAEQPTREEAAQTLRKAVEFFHSAVSSESGYVWRCSGDLTLKEGEGKASETVIWVQPPGTPTVGSAFLDAYEATADQLHLDAALDAACALLKGQLRTGGWYYHIELDSDKRQEYAYRDLPERKVRRWNRATTLDDNTTQATLRFLMRLDKILEFEDEDIHEAVMFALGALLTAQYPNGAWYVWWDHYPTRPSPEDYPVAAASYPESWSRAWTKDFSGCYVINDDLMADMVEVMLDAYEVYGDDTYLESALQAGQFLLLAQMPDPQPAWAQQYDRNMHPAWSRKFEPPAITARESHGVIATLMLLYRRTSDSKYLEPVPRALQYLQNSRLPDGRLARFYELGTNRPLYFNKEYQLTYDGTDMPTHYSFIFEPWLDSLHAEYLRLLDTNTADLWPAQERPALTPELMAQVRGIMNGMDERGAWVEQGSLRAHKVEPASGVISSSTFAKNVAALCRFTLAAR